MLFLGISISALPLRGDWFDDDDDEMAKVLAEPDAVVDQQCPADDGPMFSEEDIISTFIAPSVKAPIFNKTSRPRTRDALYQLPIYRLGITPREGFFANFFFNRFPNFTTPLIDQLGFDFDDEFFRMVLELAQSAGLIADVDGVVNLLPLLEKIGVDEHRLGFLLQYNFECDPLFFEIDTSIHLAERNLFASNTLTKELEVAFAAIFPEGEDFDKNKEFVRIRFGLGDTRLRVGVKTMDRKHLKVRAGVGLIIPTYIAGLRDGNFNSVTKSESNNTLDFLVNNIRRLVLNPEITNNHFATSYFLDAHVPLCHDCLHLRSRLSYDAFISARDNRLVMAKQEITPAQVQREDTDPEANIVNRFREQFLIPTEVIATISPGDIFFWTVMLDYIFGDFRWGIGYDYFLQQREIFQKLPKTPLPISSVRVTDATAATISSHKVGTEFGYKTGDVDLTLGGDLTLVNNNLSDDWSLYGAVGVRF